MTDDQSTPTWTVAQASQPSSGYTLPVPRAGGTAAQPAAEPATTTVEPTVQFTGPESVPAGPGGKELLIGLAVLLVAVGLLLFVRKAYVGSLVEKRHSPRQASMAGWWLYLLLLSVAAVVIFAIVGSQWFFAPLYVGPVAALALVSLIGLVVSSMKKS